MKKSNVDIAREFAQTMDADGFFVPPVVLLEQFIISIREGRIKEIFDPPVLTIRLEKTYDGTPAIRIQEPNRTDFIKLPGESVGTERFQITFANPQKLAALPADEIDMMRGLLRELANPNKQNDVSPADAEPGPFDIVNERIDVAARELAAAWRDEHPENLARFEDRYPISGERIEKLTRAFLDLDEIRKHAETMPFEMAMKFAKGEPIDAADFFKPKDPPPGNYYVQTPPEPPPVRTCDQCGKTFQGGAQVTPKCVYCSEACLVESPRSTQAVLTPAVDLDPPEQCSNCPRMLHATQGFTVLDNERVKEFRYCSQCAFVMNIDNAAGRK